MKTTLLLSLHFQLIDVQSTYEGLGCFIDSGAGRGQGIQNRTEEQRRHPLPGRQRNGGRLHLVTN